MPDSISRSGPSLEYRLDFEMLVAELSAEFVNVDPVEVDRELDAALDRLGHFFELDRSQLNEFDESGQMRVTHTWSAPEVEPIPLGTVWSAAIPEVEEVVRRGNIFSFSRFEEIPDGFDVSRATYREVGVKSHLVIPIEMGGSVIGALIFGVLRRSREWPDSFVKRLRLVTQVFANALDRREKQRRLESALAEIEGLKNRLVAESQYLREQVSTEGGYNKIIGESHAIQSVIHQIKQVAATDSTVLVLGETGTGKDLAARMVHRTGRRGDRPLIKVNCAALPSSLIESELFGHERGAFTGAVKQKIGRFELADNGTIFLDEVGDLPLDLQPELLRVLEDGEFERVGSTQTQRVDVRIITASNRDLLTAVDEGSFRADLYYRLRVVPIEMPPLRHRKEDIELLAWHFVNQLQVGLGKQIRRIPRRLLTALIEYDWPGNVRELANVIERAVILTRGDTLVIDETFTRTRHGQDESGRAAEDLQAVERAHILEILRAADWKVKGNGNAAERLGLHPSTLRKRMKRLGIERPTN